MSIFLLRKHESVNAERVASVCKSEQNGKKAIKIRMIVPSSFVQQKHVPKKTTFVNTQTFSKSLSSTL